MNLKDLHRLQHEASISHCTYQLLDLPLLFSSALNLLSMDVQVQQ